MSAQYWVYNMFRQRTIRWVGSGLRRHSTAKEIKITWRKKDFEKVTMSPVGWNIMRAAQKEGIELEGACEGVCACSTCHVILQDDIFDMVEEAEEVEDDMLDQAFGLEPTSRLGCQILITEEMDGMVVNLPAFTRNFYVDGHVPVPH